MRKKVVDLAEEEDEEKKISRQKVLNAIKTALPYVFIGNERTPSNEVLRYMRSSRHFLYENLGFIKELKEEYKDLGWKWNEEKRLGGL